MQSDRFKELFRRDRAWLHPHKGRAHRRARQGARLGRARASRYDEIDPDWNSSGGNNPGGPGGGPGGGGDFVFTFDTYTWNTAENSFQLKAGSHVLLSFTANRNAAPTEGSTYSFTLQTNDTGAPFAIDCTLELKTDNTAVFHCDASGPLSDTTQRGSWSEAEGVVTINLK